MKNKIVLLIGTRPEIVKLSVLIKKMTDLFDLKIVHTGQNYDKNLKDIFFKDLEIKNKIKYLNIKFKSASEFIGKSIIELDKYLASLGKIDGFIFLGDTNSCIASIVAKKRKIPIFHIEAGNRCFEQRVPEEGNRKLLDNISDINFVYSGIAREYLINERFDPRTIIKVGSPMKEVINCYFHKILESKTLTKLNLKKNQYIIFSTHREENIDNQITFGKILKIAKVVRKKYKLPVIFTLHPRTRNFLVKIKNYKVKFKNIILQKPFNFTDYANLCINSRLVISDSGTITEEAAILNFQAINLREEHERPEGPEEGSVIMSGIDLENVIKIIDYIFNKKVKHEVKIVNDYNVNNFSEKIIRNILSNIRFVKHRLYKQN
jgi:UDP-N-acetylglucosamine 2-epimerase (non-hydrolysing)